MSSAILQLLVLAGVAIFLILRLKNVLGTRDGFEPPRPVAKGVDSAAQRKRDGFEVIEGGPDLDITDHVPEGSPSAKALAAMKAVDTSFNVGEFLQGAGAAYEMILMGFERGDIDGLKPYLGEDVYETFVDVIAKREDEGLIVEAHFVGLRELVLTEATLEGMDAEITVRFVGELTSVVRDTAGDIVEGSPDTVKRQRDIWTFHRTMGSQDLNWQLVATGG